MPTTLVFKQCQEHSERCVTDSLGQTVVTLHPFHIQILHADSTHLAVVRERIGNFVKIIFPFVGDIFLQPSYTNTSSIPVVRTFLLAAQSFLQHDKAVKAVLQVLWIVEGTSVRANSK